ncbi:hypothetical protein [Paracoccus xiamenensis]|uniref:hypothetical protein n=1 Tax=Paracoccus xiamenensis TaxID=2714901 RepID=UPI00140DB4FF|nr:hypothetical protein [Paracoccus xiamenensis]NHF74537.1 hypothetical protein [Paracoccus xiamenensis]
MDDSATRILARIFWDLGTESAKNARGRLTHYRPWEGRDALGNKDDPNDDKAFERTVKETMRNQVKSHSPSQAIVQRYGAAGLKALQSAGFSTGQLAAVGKTIRHLRGATRGMQQVWGVYDQMTTLYAFTYSDRVVVTKYRRILNTRAGRSGFEEYAAYSEKVEPFFRTVVEFMTMLGMSIEAMPTPELDRYAIEAAFQEHGIPQSDDLKRLFGIEVPDPVLSGIEDEAQEQIEVPE